MISSLISRLVILVFGTLYPAYASYKAIRTKNINEYVRWMMYWVVFALFVSIETLTDIFLSFWFPFYYELKILVVLYLLSPATKGSSILYRKCVHPLLISHEQEIDEYIAKAKEQGYNTVLNLGTKGVSYATAVLMQTAIRGGGGLVSHIRKSYSLMDLSYEKDLGRSAGDENDFIQEGVAKRRNKKVSRASSPRRTVSSGSQVDLYFSGVDPPEGLCDYSSQIRSQEDISSGYSSADPLVPNAMKRESIGPLKRTSSVSSTSRMMTRSSSRSEASTSLADVENPESRASFQEESQSKSISSSSGNISGLSMSLLESTTLPLDLKFLFSKLTREQLVALVSNANNISSNVDSLSFLEEQFSEEEDVTKLLVKVEDKTEVECETLCEAVVLSPTIRICPAQNDQSERDNVSPKRPKKRQAPPVPSENKSIFNENVIQVACENPQKQSGLSKMLSGKLSLTSLWPKSSQEISRSESFVSLHSNESAGSHKIATAQQDGFVREMSQSPSSKRRSFHQ